MWKTFSVTDFVLLDLYAMRYPLLKVTFKIYIFILGKKMNFEIFNDCQEQLSEFTRKSEINF